MALSSRIRKALSIYVQQINDLGAGKLDDVHFTHLKFSSDSYMDEQAILSHVPSYEVCMPIFWLLWLEERNQKIIAVLR